MILKIAVLSGDGIGPEVTKQSIKVLKSLGKKFNHKIELESGLVGAVAIDKYNDPYPDETHQICLNSDAILFGAIGDPKYDNDPKAKVRPEQGLLKMRKKLGLYANLRPTKVFESLLDMSPIKEERISGTDILFVRELTGGIYFGERGRRDNDNFAFDTCEYNRDEIIRIAKIGFEYAQKRSSKLCCVDKANVLETSRLWRETVQSMEKNYPNIEVSYEASVISGSMGLMPSASVGSENALYEPIHGSYPEAAGKNIANPIASILSLSMMLDHSFNLKKESEIINNAVEESLKNKYVTPDLSSDKNSFTTDQVGDYIVDFIKKN
jgi:3-isopropylmalate dehydrogenase